MKSMSVLVVLQASHDTSTETVRASVHHVLGTALFNIFINGLAGGAEYTCSKSPYDKYLGAVLAHQRAMTTCRWTSTV